MTNTVQQAHTFNESIPALFLNNNNFRSIGFREIELDILCKLPFKKVFGDKNIHIMDPDDEPDYCPDPHHNFSLALVARHEHMAVAIDIHSEIVIIIDSYSETFAFSSKVAHLNGYKGIHAPTQGLVNYLSFA